jgi:hypothetical protein
MKSYRYIDGLMVCWLSMLLLLESLSALPMMLQSLMVGFAGP